MSSKNQTRSREFFFKYMPADTACKVLTNRTLRWSSPVLFNDPFDVPRELAFGITHKEIAEALTERLRRLILNPPEDTSVLETKLRFIVETMKSGITATQRRQLLDGLTGTENIRGTAAGALDELREMWRGFVPDFRILCLTESPSHVAMWHHYADRYRGAVLQFRCIEQLDSAWFAARQVKYPVEKPSVYTADGWASLLTMPRELSVRQIIDISALTKSADWSYEKEWRVTTFKRDDDVGHFSDYPFHRSELAGIYLGPHIGAADRKQLIALSKQYSPLNIWSVEIGMDRELRFIPASE